MKNYINYINNETTICNYPFLHVDVNTDSTWHVCCETAAITNKSEHPTVSSYWNSETVNSIRKSMLNGEKHPHCSHCWKNEENGKISFRQLSTERMVTLLGKEKFDKIIKETNTKTGISPISSIKSIQLRLSNLCNLKCRMCNPLYSTRWATDWKKLDDDLRNNSKKQFKEVDWEMLVDHPLMKLDDKHFKNMIESLGPNLEKITISGGEPLMETRLYKVVEILEPYAKNISMTIVSNATQLENLNEINKNWKSFTFVISCDGIEDYYEYIRQLSSWKEFSNNVSRIHEYENIIIVFNVCVQIYNYPNLIKTLIWLLDNFSNKSTFWVELIFLESPQYLSLRSLPNNIKNRLFTEWSEWADRLANDTGIFSYRWRPGVRHNMARFLRRVINMMMIDQDHIQTFVRYSDQLDRIQNVKITWRELLPELAEELKNE